MKIVAIKNMSQGNETVGDMWQETKIFEGDTTIAEVMAWGEFRSRRIVLTVPDGEEFPRRPFRP